MSSLTTIKELAATQFGIDADTIDTTLTVDALGIDSLGFLEFLFELEDRLSISIPQDSLVHVRTLGQLAAVVDGLLAAKSTDGEKDLLP